MLKRRGEQLADLTGAVPLQLTRDRRSAFGGYLSKAITRFGVPGAAVAVIQAGKVTYLRVTISSLLRVLGLTPAGME
jgi:hypothetical protein